MKKPVQQRNELYSWTSNDFAWTYMELHKRFYEKVSTMYYVVYPTKSTIEYSVKTHAKFSSPNEIPGREAVVLITSEREREKERQTDRQIDR